MSSTRTPKKSIPLSTKRFQRWLSLQVDRSDLVGLFAKDAMSDKCIWTACKTLADFERHIKEFHGAQQKYMRGLRQARSEFMIAIGSDKTRMAAENILTCTTQTSFKDWLCLQHANQNVAIRDFASEAAQDDYFPDGERLSVFKKYLKQEHGVFDHAAFRALRAAWTEYQSCLTRLSSSEVA